MIINRGKTEEKIAESYLKWISARDKAKEDSPKESTPVTPVSLEIEEPFILTYNDYGKELITKSNELFKGTKAEISIDNLQANQEIPNMYILKRLALITTICKDPQLKNYGFLPITPLQSEQLLKQGKLPKPDQYWEDLALILYDLNGTNPKEAQASKQSLQEHKQELGLSNSDLESRLLIINSGLEKDSSMPNKVKPIILPGLTQVYAHETLKKTGEHKFEYGLEHGWPGASDLGKGSRDLYMPSSNENIGLRVLYRYGGLYLVAWYEDLVCSYLDGRVNFARQKL